MIAFSVEKTEWLRLIKEHVSSSCAIEQDDFNYNLFADRGGLQKVWGLFDQELDRIMTELNQELVA
jgi:type I restriction enzyme R subunit